MNATLTRDQVRAVLDEFGVSDAEVASMDELDFLEYAMLIEEDNEVYLPQFFAQLQPPPPYANREALIDAFIASATPPRSQP